MNTFLTMASAPSMSGTKGNCTDERQRHLPQRSVDGVRLYATVGQAMAGYIAQGDFDIVHLHDYHVGLVPFYLGDAYLQSVPVYLTIHNATYQGITPLKGGGYSTLDYINLPGEKLFHKYFDFFNNLNLLKACMLKVHEIGGKITTVSGDLLAPGAMRRSCVRVMHRCGRGHSSKSMLPRGSLCAQSPSRSL